MYLIISICTYQVSNWGPEEEDDLLLPTALYFMNLKWSNLKLYCLTKHQLEAKTETIWIIFNNKLKTELTITQLLASSERCLVSLVVVVDVKVIVVIGLKSRLPPTTNFPGGKTNFFRLFWFCVKKMVKNRWGKISKKCSTAGLFWAKLARPDFQSKKFPHLQNATAFPQWTKFGSLPSQAKYKRHPNQLIYSAASSKECLNRFSTTAALKRVQSWARRK